VGIASGRTQASTAVVTAFTPVTSGHAHLIGVVGLVRVGFLVHISVAVSTVVEIPVPVDVRVPVGVRIAVGVRIDVGVGVPVRPRLSRFVGITDGEAVRHVAFAWRQEQRAGCQTS